MSLSTSPAAYPWAMPPSSRRTESSAGVIVRRILVDVLPGDSRPGRAPALSPRRSGSLPPTSNPQRSTSGATVTSNAPPVRSETFRGDQQHPEHVGRYRDRARGLSPVDGRYLALGGESVGHLFDLGDPRKRRGHRFFQRRFIVPDERDLDDGPEGKAGVTNRDGIFFEVPETDERNDYRRADDILQEMRWFSRILGFFLVGAGERQFTVFPLFLEFLFDGLRSLVFRTGSSRTAAQTA